MSQWRVPLVCGECCVQPQTPWDPCGEPCLRSILGIGTVFFSSSYGPESAEYEWVDRANAP